MERDEKPVEVRPSVPNPFAVERAGDDDALDTVSTAYTQRELAEVQCQIVLAQRFPRDPVQCMERILNACTRQGLAETALYQYSRSGTDITGPSIRLAETIAQYWRNLSFGVREVGQDTGLGESIVEAFAWDCETNVRQTKTFRVSHWRHTRKGSYKLEDPRDIYEAVANQGARRLRACILGIIPGDVVEAAVKQCDVTLATTTPVTPERIAAMLQAFSEHGVTREQIEARIQRRVDAITPGQLAQLGKVYNSLRDGMSKAEDWFETAAVAAPAAADAQPGAVRATKGSPAPKSAPSGVASVAASLAGQKA